MSDTFLVSQPRRMGTSFDRDIATSQGIMIDRRRRHAIADGDLLDITRRESDYLRRWFVSPVGYSTEPNSLMQPQVEHYSLGTYH